MNEIVTAVVIVAVIGLICGVVLAAASHFMDVPTDEKFTLARECLPGANCGACGYTGCDGYANALAKGETTATNLCVPGGDTAALAISKALGLAYSGVEEKVAYVHCNGNCDETRDRALYTGIQNCSSASLIYGGPKACVYGCLGFGDCALKCPEGAICVTSGIAKIDMTKCIGCGICVKTCPKHIISLIPVTAVTAVECSSADPGAVTRKTCENGCIGCKKCEKECPENAITVSGNLAKIDYSVCTRCGKCASVCPVGALKNVNFNLSYGAKKAL